MPFFSHVSTALLVAVIFGLLQAAIGLILATDYALGLLQRVRTVMARFARRSLAFLGPRVPRIRKSAATAFAFIVGLGVATSRATRRLGVATSGATGLISVATSHATRRVGDVTSGATRHVRSSVPRSGERIVSGARPDVRLLPDSGANGTSASATWLLVLAALTAGVLALFVVSFLSP